MTEQEPPMEEKLEASMERLMADLDCGQELDLQALSRQFALPIEVLEDGLRGLTALEGINAEGCGVEQLGSYKLEKEIGRGGMGVVYLATNSKTGQQVVVKIMQSSVYSERFIIEAESMMRLRHNNIVELLDHDLKASQPYFVMPYFERGSIGQSLKKHKTFPVERALRVALDVCSALAFAHSQGILHRDVKPHNILLNNDGTAVLSDFGLARDLERSTRHTEFGDFIGTLGYVPPEQVTAEREDVDHRVDIYGLGVTLFEMVTGITPFGAHLSKQDIEVNAKTLLGGRIGQELVDFLAAEPSVPGDFIGSKSSKAFDDICRRCLYGKKKKRYPHVAALAEDIAGWLGQLPPRLPLPKVVKRQSQFLWWVREMLGLD
jgi:serine/threonine protein kinase